MVYLWQDADDRHNEKEENDEKISIICSSAVFDVHLCGIIKRCTGSF
jgi:hypothetical protein